VPRRFPPGAASAARALRVAALLLAAAGCASPAPRAAVPPPAPSGLTPTACERYALLTGKPPDVGSPAAAAENLRWGALSPESCPDAGRLDDSPPGMRRR
jgi:hypothetical protein